MWGRGLVRGGEFNHLLFDRHSARLTLFVNPENQDCGTFVAGTGGMNLLTNDAWIGEV